MESFDTSIVIAVYCPESLSSLAQQSIRESPDCVISSLVRVEFVSALAQKIRTHQLDVQTAESIFALFQSHIHAGVVDILPVERREFLTAQNWLSQFKTPLRTLDALQLAAAFNHSRTLVTADKGLAASAKILGVPCRLISG